MMSPQKTPVGTWSWEVVYLYCTVLCTVARGLEATNKKKKDWSVGVAGVKG